MRAAIPDNDLLGAPGTWKQSRALQRSDDARGCRATHKSGFDADAVLFIASGCSPAASPIFFGDSRRAVVVSSSGLSRLLVDARRRLLSATLARRLGCRVKAAAADAEGDAKLPPAVSVSTCFLHMPTALPAPRSSAVIRTSGSPPSLATSRVQPDGFLPATAHGAGETAFRSPLQRSRILGEPLLEARAKRR